MTRQPQLKVVAGTDVEYPISKVFRNAKANKDTPARHLVWFSELPNDKQILGAFNHIHQTEQIGCFSRPRFTLASYLDKKKVWFVLEFFGYEGAPNAVRAGLTAQGFDTEVIDMRDGWHATGIPAVIVRTYLLWM